MTNQGLSLINRFRKRKIVTATGAVDLIAPPSSPGFDTNPSRIATSLTAAGETSVVVAATKPKNVSTTGNILIERSDGSITSHPYSAFTSDSTTITFTITSHDFDVLTALAGNAVYLPLSYRCVLTAWRIEGQNTNAAVTTYTIRNKATAANVLFGGAMHATTGTVREVAQERFVPGTAGETIELNVAGAITGQIEVEIEGGFLPSSVPCVNEYVGTP